MSLIRLIMLDVDEAKSGLIPSRSIPTSLYVVAQDAYSIHTFWDKVREIDPNLHEHFIANEDSLPLLEGIGDGLLVVNWEHHCIESFQEYQPVTPLGIAVKHNGMYSLDDLTVPYKIGSGWHIVDHLFGGD